MVEKFITDIPGVYASGIGSGIKASGKLDLGYIFVPECAGSAGVFTRNLWAASSVSYTRSLVANGRTLKAVIVNSGNANACTGEEGEQDTRDISLLGASLLGISQSEVAVASTGVIGKRLPMENVRSGLNALLANPLKKEGELFTNAILTTDKFKKTCSSTKKVGSREINIIGTTKGCGMIAPNMATTLSFLVTDASIPSATLQYLLTKATACTFNMTSVDTDTSTNDMVLLFATGETPLSTDTEMESFYEQLKSALGSLALQLVQDGEGATKTITVSVKGAGSEEEARIVARNIANSPLVKTAIYGGDPNWGRIVAAMGKDPDVRFSPSKVDLFFGEVAVLKAGQPLDQERDVLLGQFSEKEVLIGVNLHYGEYSATAFGCDLTHGYIDINTQYS